MSLNIIWNFFDIESKLVDVDYTFWIDLFVGLFVNWNASLQQEYIHMCEGWSLFKLLKKFHIFSSGGILIVSFFISTPLIYVTSLHNYFTILSTSCTTALVFSTHVHRGSPPGKWTSRQWKCPLSHCFKRKNKQQSLGASLRLNWWWWKSFHQMSWIIFLVEATHLLTEEDFSEWEIIRSSILDRTSQSGECFIVHPLSMKSTEITPFSSQKRKSLLFILDTEIARTFWFWWTRIAPFHRLLFQLCVVVRYPRCFIHYSVWKHIISFFSTLIQNSYLLQIMLIVMFGEHLWYPAYTQLVISGLFVTVM